MIPSKTLEIAEPTPLKNSRDGAGDPLKNDMRPFQLMMIGPRLARPGCCPANFQWWEMKPIDIHGSRP